MIETTPNRWIVLGLLFAATAAGACGRKAASEQSSGGAVDTTAVSMSAVTPAEGPGVQVTRTDAKSVSLATKYKLTPANFSAFLAGADSLAALETRDTTVRAYLANDLTDAGSKDADAGLRWLESNRRIADALNTAGISPRDYFVESIAIAAAEQFINDPKAAPPTPTLTANAEFLRGRQPDLQHLRTLREGKPVVTVTPK